MDKPGTGPAQGLTVGDQPEQLVRAITAPLLFFYVLGSGIYALVGTMAGQVGGAFWTSFAVGVSAAMLTGFAYAELITKYPKSAGAALYTNRAFNNRFVTFVVTFATVAASLAATGALALAGATLAFFAMTGFENAANVAEEVQDPSRVYPRALLGGMATAGVIYLVIAFVAAMVVPTGKLAGSEVALLTVVRQGAPGFPGWLFAIVACIAITNTCLVALITNSRIMYGMAREGIVPRIFARTHHARRTPWIAIIFTTIIALLLIVGVGEAGVGTLANATVAFLLSVFALVCLCALILRREDVEQQHYTAPTFLLVLGVVVNIALLPYVLITDVQGLVAGDVGARESVVVVCLVMLLVGVVLYFVNNLAQRRLDTPGTPGGQG